MSDDPLAPPPLPRTSRSNFWTGALVVGILLGALVLGVHEADVTPQVAKTKNVVAFNFQKFGTEGTFSSEALKGQVVLLDFWASWCAPCALEMPWLTRVAKEYESKGVVFIAPSHDDNTEELGEFVGKHPLLKDAAALTNEAAIAGFGLEALPSLFVIGRDGAVRSARRGLVEEAEVRRWLDDALKDSAAN